MTIYEPNPDVRPTGEEAGEFLDDGPVVRGEEDADEDEDEEIEPGRRRTGVPPTRREEPPPLG
jgi:hypothetical protein